MDYFRLLFLWAVILISSRVFIFSSSYIKEDKFLIRFHYLLFLFIISIIILVLSPNLIRLLLGWDGLGIRSYLLVIYYARPKSFNAGIITFARNRVGDALIIISLSFMLYHVRLNIILLSRVIEISYNWVIVIIIAAAFTKRAQIPFRAWLPAAIAAPTPVSALVHSSTLVTAGVYVLFRFDSLMCYLSLGSLILTLGALTIFIARIGAFFEIDIKKIVALSTLRQLGVMMAALGAGFRTLGFFHLLAHAFFKALLFISTGNLIHGAGRYQDLRVMGGVREVLPFSKRVVIGCSMRLCGLPFISAFYSKEIIIESLLINNFSLMPYFIILLGILITIFYSMRFIILTIRRASRQLSLLNKSDEDFSINLRIMILFPPAVVGGRLISSFMRFKPLFITGDGLKLIVLTLLTMGFYLFFKINQRNYLTRIPLMWGISRLWGLSFFRTRLPVNIFLRSGDFLHKLVDFSWLYFIFSNSYYHSSTPEFNMPLFQNLLFMRVFRRVIIFMLIIFLFTN